MEGLTVESKFKKDSDLLLGQHPELPFGIMERDGKDRWASLQEGPQGRTAVELLVYRLFIGLMAETEQR